MGDYDDDLETGQNIIEDWENITEPQPGLYLLFDAAVDRSEQFS